MTDDTPPAPASQETEEPAQALVLTPPAPVPAVSPKQAAVSAVVDDATARQIDQAVTAFVDALVSLDVHSPDFQRKMESVSQMGNQEIRRSAEVSNRFLDKPMASLERGPLGQGSNVSNSLVQLRRQVEELDPTRQGLVGSHRILGIIPFGNRVRDYFTKYQSAQRNIDGIIQSLYHGQEELQRDNAAIEQEKVNLWQMKGRLEQYAYMASKLDEALDARIRTLELGDPERAKTMQEDVLFYVRQKHQDVLTQLAVNMQGYLALDLVRKNNHELIKGVDRATTTTVSALRTAVIVAQALTNQRLVLDQITALNTTTSSLIESTSTLLRQQTDKIYTQAANATVDIQKLQTAFNNIYATMDSIDRFKVQALDNMRTTVNTLSREIQKAQVYMERARTAEVGEARAAALTTGGELTLPGGEEQR
ncbi:MAG TPA: toxic anion resistance protein [Candidatus Dormibacteraeota bacterium]|nr:toxic anion resistance protein [Candidatus Dormibacteraeota bacterium]